MSDALNLLAQEIADLEAKAQVITKDAQLLREIHTRLSAKLEAAAPVKRKRGRPSQKAHAPAACTPTLLTTAPVAKKRGRPSKKAQNVLEALVAQAKAETVAKKRGRPAKVKTDASPEAASKEVTPGEAKILSLLKDGKPRRVPNLAKEVNLQVSTVWHYLKRLMAHGVTKSEDSEGYVTYGCASA
jgi:DNA-binding MarR family transcriptional regulator